MQKFIHNYKRILETCATLNLETELLFIHSQARMCITLNGIWHTFSI